ncbi:MAG: sensor histidine kinase [Acidobacteriota bacterium]
MLERFAEGKLGQITSISYGVRDGMRNAECNGGRQPAGLRARDGRLWFPTVDGVMVIDPKGVSFNPLPPPVLIESVLVTRNEIDFDEGLEIPAGQQSLEIQYTGLSLVRPEAVSFRYKIEGLDANWTEAGNRRAAFYSYLPAGEYTFRVIAANADGVWNEVGAAIRLVVIPPFYQTWWFQGLVIITLSGIGALIYRLRIDNLKRARAAQEEFSRRLVSSQESERKRIAAELHDSLGQSLLVIKNRAFLGSKKIDDQKAALKQFDQITSAVSHAIEEVRSIAHDLRPLHLERLGLTAAIESIINDVSSSSEIKLSAHIDSIDGCFSPEAEINLYRIVQEGVNNIIKHSGAKEARVEIKRAAGRVSIRIQDDGRGFAAGVEAGSDNKMNSSSRRGFGLLGISERARMLGGRCMIQSAPDKGTLLSITVDLENQSDGEGR